MAQFRINSDRLVVIDVPPGIERSISGALHLKPLSVVELTEGEAKYAGELGIKLVRIGQASSSRRGFNPPKKNLAKLPLEGEAKKEEIKEELKGKKGK